MTVLWVILIVLGAGAVCIGGYLYNRSGPGDNVRDPNVKARRNNWVP